MIIAALIGIGAQLSRQERRHAGEEIEDDVSPGVSSYDVTMSWNRTHAALMLLRGVQDNDPRIKPLDEFKK